MSNNYLYLGKTSTFVEDSSQVEQIVRGLMGDDGRWQELQNSLSEPSRSEVAHLRNYVSGSLWMSNGRDVATIYRRIGREGAKRNFHVGDELANLRDIHHEDGKTLLGFPIWVEWNDRIQSINVGEGFFVVLYEHANYEGDRLIVVGSACIDNLDRFHMYDRASSLAVYPIADIDRALSNPEPTKSTCKVDSQTHSEIKIVGHHGDMVRDGNILSCHKDVVFFTAKRGAGTEKEYVLCEGQVIFESGLPPHSCSATGWTEAEAIANLKSNVSLTSTARLEYSCRRVKMLVVSDVVVSGGGVQTCFAVRHGKNRDLLRLYAPLGKWRYVSLHQRFGEEIRVEFSSPTTVVVHLSDRSVRTFVLNVEAGRWEVAGGLRF
jgi:hypothetical protein